MHAVTERKQTYTTTQSQTRKSCNHLVKDTDDRFNPDSTGFHHTCDWTVLEFVEAIKSILLSRTNSFNLKNSHLLLIFPYRPALDTFFTLHLHGHLDNEGKMNGQLLSFILFALYHFYFIQLDIIFLTDQRDVLLQTSFGTGGFLFQILSLKNSSKPAPPPPPPTPLPKVLWIFSVFLFHSCRNVVFRAASVPSVL